MSDHRTLISRVWVVAVLFVATSIVPAAADILSLYTVSDIAVDERSTDELAAKNRGIELAQQAALQKLLEKITLRDHFDRLPDIDAAVVQRTIRDYAITEEKFGGGRYVAKLSVRFKRRAVRELLRARKVPIAETVSRSVLVLPVYRAAGSILLWDEPNPWFNAWANRPSPTGLLPLTVPLGDYSDVAVISANQALNGSEEHLAAIAKKYGTIGTLVTVAELVVDPRSGSPTIEISMSRFGKADAGRTFVRSFSGSAEQGVDKLLADAVEALIIRAEEDWKRDNLQRATGQQQLSIVVPLTSLSSWLMIRERMMRVSPIIDILLVRLSVKEALIDLKYSGGPDQLRLSMAQSDLDLEFVRDRGGYVLRLGRP
tara:strand:- start:136 stop:1251 length:1116 start_codon:yes stop_codon:yes gene_type:complete